MRTTIQPQAIDRAVLADHFLALTPAARWLRFGRVTSDSELLSHVDRLLGAPDHVFAVVDAASQICGVVQLEFSDGYADLGISISRHPADHTTYGLLLERAWLHALGRGVDTVFVRNLYADSALRKAALDFGMQVAIAEASEATTLEIPALLGSSLHQRLFGQILTIADHGLRGRWDSRRGVGAMHPGSRYPVLS